MEFGVVARKRSIPLAEFAGPVSPRMPVSYG
jgi:hypothetical protein